VSHHQLDAFVLFVAAHLQLYGQLAQLLVVALEEVADQGDARSGQNHHQAGEDLRTVESGIHENRLYTPVIATENRSSVTFRHGTALPKLLGLTYYLIASQARNKPSGSTSSQ